VTATFNTPCELLGKLSVEEARGVVRKLGVLTPREGAENSLIIIDVVNMMISQLAGEGNVGV